MVHSQIIGSDPANGSNGNHHYLVIHSVLGKLNYGTERIVDSDPRRILEADRGFYDFSVLVVERLLSRPRVRRSVAFFVFRHWIGYDSSPTSLHFVATHFTPAPDCLVPSALLNRPVSAF